MAPATVLRHRAWVERARVAALAARILEVDRSFLRFGDGFLTSSEAEVLRALATRLGAVPA
jgi:hypothetical protein